MSSRCRDHTSVGAGARDRCRIALTVVASCCLLRRWEATIISCRVGCIATIGCVVLLTRLWADASEASETRASLAGVVVVVVVIGVADRASTLVDVLVWTEVVVVRGVNSVIAVANVVDMHVGANVCLPKLIQNGSGSLGVDR